MPSDFVFTDEETDADQNTAPAAAPWNILIVDDDPVVHSTTRFAFAQVRHRDRALQFASALSGSEAIRCIADAGEHLPDLVLMDVVMATPTDGIDTTHRIREMLEQRMIPYVIVRTGQAGTLLDHSALHRDPDIDDVVFKQDLTADRLKTAVLNGLDKVVQRCSPPGQA